MPEKLTPDQHHNNFRKNREQKNHDSCAEVLPKVTTARHRNMAAIRGKDTKPEMIVRKYLWSHGFRYRLNHPRLPGKPDIVLRKYRTCIFVNGCFWHGHGLAMQEVKSEELKVTNVLLSFISELHSSACCKIPKTNREFWVKKIRRNMERDIEVQRKLASMGWHCITIWECELVEHRPHQPGEKSIRERTLESLVYTLSKIFLQNHKVRRYELPEEDECAMVAEEKYMGGRRSLKRQSDASSADDVLDVQV